MKNGFHAPDGPDLLRLEFVRWGGGIPAIVLVAKRSRGEVRWMNIEVLKPQEYRIARLNRPGFVRELIS